MTSVGRGSGRAGYAPLAEPQRRAADLRAGRAAVLAPLLVLIIALGIFPGVLTSRMRAAYARQVRPITDCLTRLPCPRRERERHSATSGTLASSALPSRSPDLWIRTRYIRAPSESERQRGTDTASFNLQPTGAGLAADPARADHAGRSAAGVAARSLAAGAKRKCWLAFSRAAGGDCGAVAR